MYVVVERLCIAKPWIRAHNCILWECCNTLSSLLIKCEMSAFIMQSFDRTYSTGGCVNLEDVICHMRGSLVPVVGEMRLFIRVLEAAEIITRGRDSFRRSVYRPLTRCEPPSPING